MKVFIIEDEDHAVQYLRFLVSNSPRQMEVVHHAPSVKKALEYLDQDPDIDIIFMDIHLEDGLSFEIFKHRDITVPVIFTTAFDAYAIKAFEYMSIAYLLKPISQDQFDQAISKLELLQNAIITKK